MKTQSKRPFNEMRGSGFSYFAKALWLFTGVSFLLIATIFIAVIVAPTGCKSRIDGGKEAIGAEVYLNGQFLGVMEKKQSTWDDRVLLWAELCTRWRLRKGDILQVVKKDYKDYEAVIDPYIDESGPPYHIVEVELAPVSLGDESKAP